VTTITISHNYMTSRQLRNKLSQLPPGQAKALRAILDPDNPSGRTYKQAAEVAGISLGTLYTHLRRVRQNHPKIYAAVMGARSIQLEVRHQTALTDRRLRSREWWDGVNKAQFYMLGGWNRRPTADERFMSAVRKEMSRRRREGLSTNGVADWARWNS